MFNKVNDFLKSVTNKTFQSSYILKENKKIVYIHGARATSKSFEYLKFQLSTHQDILIDYDTEKPLKEFVHELNSELSHTLGESKFTIIGHSLGGIIAVHLANLNKNVEKIVTLSTPFGGSKQAAILKWFCPGYALFNDMAPKSHYMKEFGKIKLDIPVMSFVTTGGGVPIFYEPNDGVVTIASQKSIKFPKYIDSSCGHFEILLDKDVSKQINQFIFNE